MNFRHTRIRPDRPLWSYSKVQWALGHLLRNRTMFVNRGRRFEYLNVGCGDRPAEGFCNVDWSWRPGIRCLDITRGIPLPDSSLRGIFTEHCLEHLDRAKCLGVLRDFRRMLKPGGVARIIVPDGELYCSLYVRARSGENVNWPYPEEGQPAIYHVNQIMRDHGHLFIYDFEAMRDALLAAGFREARRVSFRAGADPVLLIDQESRAPESLYVEGIV